MSLPEQLLWLSLALYLAAWFAALTGTIFGLPRLNRTSSVLAGLGVALQSYVLIVRWTAISHPPLFGTFENTQAAGWVLVIFTLSLSLFYKRLPFLGSATFIWAVGLMSYGMVFNKNRIPLTISEQSIWVDLHVIFAWIAFGSFIIAWSIAFRILRGAIPAGWLNDRLLKFLLLGFVTYTIMVALGSVYEFFLFGKWWQWDLVETLSLITWVYYGLTIHTRLFYPKREKPLAWMVVFGPIGIIASYFLLVLLPGRSFHIFDLPF